MSKAAQIVNEMLDPDDPSSVLRQHVKAVSHYTVKYPSITAEDGRVVITRVVDVDDLDFFTQPRGVKIYGSFWLRKANIWDGAGKPIQIDFPEIEL